ncbi:MAG TPA: hypothetical protein VL285_03610 [Bryobacteraceae bacterium]|nr:hypothetical protein [Bryobacteraceae bacterium]
MRSFTKLRIGVAGVLLCSALASGQRSPEPPASAPAGGESIDEKAFDRQLERILSESPTIFRRLEGARLENRLREYYFEAKLYLPGAAYCRILKHEGTTVYTCEWENRKKIDFYTRLVRILERSLGPEWDQRPSARGKGQQVIFSGDRKPTVQVIWQPAAAAVHVVILPDGASRNGIQSDLPLLPDFFHPKSRL